MNSSATTQPDLKAILALVADEMQLLEDSLLNQISPASRSLSTILQNIFKAGGKRLRPAIAFLVFKAVSEIPEHKSKSQELQEKLLLVAEISELIHTASLVHDDIIDNSLLRRSLPTVNSKWNNAITVISGDFMFARAAVNLGKLEINQIVCAYASVLEQLCDGEIEQFEHKFDLEMSLDYYFSKTFKKTASLFEAGAKSVGYLFQLSSEETEKLANYAAQLGMAFQVIDDVLDYTASESDLGKPAGSDLKEGQITLPVIYAVEELSKHGDIDKFRAALRALAESDTEQIPTLLEKVKSTQGIARAIATAEDFVTKAKQSLDFLPESSYKNALFELADFVVSRTN